MNNIIKFSEELSNLIQENKDLKDKLNRTEEYLKLAIVLNGNLKFKTIENIDRESYKNFIENTIIVYGGNLSGGIHLMWKKPNMVEYNGQLVIGYNDVEEDEIKKIFNL